MSVAEDFINEIRRANNWIRSTNERPSALRIFGKNVGVNYDYDEDGDEYMEVRVYLTPPDCHVMVADEQGTLIKVHSFRFYTGKQE